MQNPTFDELRHLFGLSRDFLCVASLDGYFIRLNPAWTRLGYTLEELCARPFLTFVHPDDRARTERELKTQLGSGSETIAFENRYLARDGSAIWLRWNAVADTAQQRIYAVAIDVTEHKHLTAELGDARDAALASSRAKSRFLAAVSHQVRTPLNGVMGLADLLLSSELTPAQRADLESIHSLASRLLTRFEQILTFAELEGEERLLEPLPLDARATLAAIVDEHRGRARQRGLELSLAVAPEVPPEVRIDPWALRQILNALIENAVRFTPAGWVAVTLEPAPAAPREARELRLAVADSGVGVAPEHADRLLEPFRTGDASPDSGGDRLGLGLAIVKKLVDLMKGQLQIEPGTEQGTRVSVTLPAPAVAAPRARAGLARPPQGEGATEAARILVVEDNAINQRVALRLLEERGHVGEVASNGIEALAMLDQGDYDVVLMDAQMPAMDGYTTTREIRTREQPGQRIPIIGLTADALFDSRQRCLAAGMDDFLTKPIQAQQLFDAISTHLRGRQPSPVVAVEQLKSAADGERAFERELVELFFSDVDRHLDGLPDLARGGHNDAIAQHAHAVRGAAAHVGAIRLAEVAGRLEGAALAGETDRVARLVEEITREVTRARAYFQRYLADDGGAG